MTYMKCQQVVRFLSYHSNPPPNKWYILFIAFFILEAAMENCDGTGEAEFWDDSVVILC